MNIKAVHSCRCSCYSAVKFKTTEWSTRVHWGILFARMNYIPRKRIPGFSLLCVFVLLLRGPWCQLRLSVQWNQTGGMGAGYSAIFLDLSVVHQIWGWSLHTCLTCLWGSQQFSQLCDHRWFQIRQCNHASSSQWEIGRWLWSMAW